MLLLLLLTVVGELIFGTVATVDSLVLLLLEEFLILFKAVLSPPTAVVVVVVANDVELGTLHASLFEALLLLGRLDKTRREDGVVDAKIFELVDVVVADGVSQRLLPLLCVFGAGNVTTSGFRLLGVVGDDKFELAKFSLALERYVVLSFC